MDQILVKTVGSRLLLKALELISFVFLFGWWPIYNFVGLGKGF